MKGSVVAELCPRQPLEPLARPMLCKASEVHCDDFVGGLKLPVGLTMEG
jgi:hypothetical protein